MGGASPSVAYHRPLTCYVVGGHAQGGHSSNAHPLFLCGVMFKELTRRWGPAKRQRQALVPTCPSRTEPLRMWPLRTVHGGLGRGWEELLLQESWEGACPWKSVSAGISRQLGQGSLNACLPEAQSPF